MSTPTTSRDGQYRIDMRITFRVSISELATYLASATRHIEMERLAGILTGLTAKHVRETARTEMERRGFDYMDAWADNFGYDETIQRLALAEKQIRRAFPELAKADREREQQTAPTLAPVNQISGPTAIEPSDTCSVCGKEECANEVCGAEPPASAVCRHGNTPRADATGAPVAECEKRHHGNVEYGAFNSEGCFYSGEGCAVDAANAAAQESETEDDITWGRMCTDHEGEPADHCAECNGEPEPTCTDCAGDGCHWCNWTGKRR